MVASLGMYDHPAQQAANDRIWASMAHTLRECRIPRALDVPDTLDRSRAVQPIWRDPDLVFAQVCGYPLMRDETLSLRVLGVPVYAAPGCTGDIHRSVVVARLADGETGLADYRGRRAVLNDTGSNSGMNLFRAVIAPVAGRARFFDSVVVTGSHRDSIRAIVAGDADIAAIDCVTYAALDRFEPDLTRALQIVAHTPVSPTLPFVTSRTTDAGTVAALRIALEAMLEDPALAEDRATMFLAGMTIPADDRFAGLLALERAAIEAGYPDLR